MRYILILLLSTGVLMAKQKETCYSVQLKSFSFKKESTYNFEEQNYPESCQLISFTNMNAVRCGCFTKYNEAKKQQKIFEPVYHESMIVTTYKYRFASKKSIVNSVAKNTIEQPVDMSPVEPVEVYQSYMKDIAIQGNINLAAQSYITRPSAKHTNNYTASAELDMTYNKGDFKAFAQFRAQQDYYDIKGGSDDTKRSYLRINELYAQYDFEDSQVLFGKSIRYWGALEVHNLTDGFNIVDFRSDPTEKDKVGSWNASYTKYTDNGELSIIAKFNEENRKMPAYPYVYYPFTNVQITYDNDVNTEKSVHRPSIYLKYSSSTDTEYTLDYSIILQNGYDSQRYYSEPSTPVFKVMENAYLVNKLMSYNTLVVGSTLVKLEAVYADVIDDDLISDYYNIGLGVEHTIGQVYGEADLGLLAEYYKYETLENGKYDDLQLFEVFQNDIFLGARYSFNEGNDATIVGGAILDLDYGEQVYYVEYEGRINDMFKLNIDYRQVESSSSTNTALKRMGKQKRLSMKVGYYF